jgi:nicotinate-nucleotide adenylyltransferase
MGRLMRIGVIGGTFDPPHTGHLILAEQARDQLNLDRVLWVPAGDPPHKQSVPISPITDRVEMVGLAIRDNDAFSISDVDIARPGPHFTADMLELVEQQTEASELYLVLGGDSLRDLPTWHEHHRLLRSAWLAVMGRPDAPIDLDMLETMIPGISSRVRMLETPLIYISGSDIRNRVKNGNSVRYLVPDTVGDYILRNRLYLAS